MTSIIFLIIIINPAYPIAEVGDAHQKTPLCDVASLLAKTIFVSKKIYENLDGSKRGQEKVP